MHDCQDRAIEHVKERHEQELQSLARVHTAEVRAVTESLERDLSSHKQQWQEERAVSCALVCRPNRCNAITHALLIYLVTGFEVETGDRAIAN